MGRPLKPIDSDQVYKLAKLGATQTDCAEWFGVARSTIAHRYAREFQLGRAVCKKNLRLWQMRRARQGSDALLIHLGKAYLDQRDKAGPAAELDDAQTYDDHGEDLEP